MNFENQNNGTIQDKFEAYHKANPSIYNLFKRYTWEMIRKRGKASSKLIINQIRWEININTKRQEGDFKINDAFTSRYVRMLLENHPEISGYFELRNLRAE